jgi:hypothetical protein
MPPATNEKDMLTYQVRPRVVRVESDKELAFPAECRINFYFQPLQPFGESAGGGRTAMKASPASAYFNANTGEHTIESEKSLIPLDVTIEAPHRTMTLKGRTLSISQECSSLKELTELIEGIYFCLPSLINVRFADAPYVERVDGRIGQVGFRWELQDWRGEYQITTQDLQEERVVQAWNRLSLLAEPSRRRLAAGLHYLHVASRLSNAGVTAGEFIAEVILNWCKALEAIFSPIAVKDHGNGPTKGPGTRDAVRAGLRKLGYDNDVIDRDFIPAMLLRNSFDVGHVQLALYKMEHLQTIHAYTERAGLVFQDMFDRLLTMVEAGQFDVASYEFTGLDKEILQTIHRMQQCEMNRPQ